MIDTLSYAPDGGFHALLAPGEKPIDFGHVAQRLAGTLRFNGTQGALSVAQHAVTGAQAILSEGGDGLTAALFLHHDDHEFVLGDITSPVIAALEALNPGARAALQQLAGRTLARALSPGQAIRADMVRVTSVVQSGDPVRLRISGPGFAVAATGQALGAAGEGQTVRVRTDLGKILLGVAREGRHVDVAL